MEEEDHYELTTRLGSSKRRKWICITTLLGCCLVLSLLVIVALSTVLGLRGSMSSANPSAPNSSNGSNDSNSSVCLTPACIDLSSTVRSALNEDIDPCEDFYNFTCGGWERKNVVPPNSDSNEMSLQLLGRNQIAMKKLLESKQDGGVAAVRKAIDAYHSCMDTKTINRVGIQPLLELISSTGGWSLIDGENSSWSINGELFVKERLLSSQAFFLLGVDVDPKNSSRHLLVLQQSGLSNSKPSAYLNSNSTFPDSLKNVLFTVISTLAPNLSKTAVEEAADGIVEFETNLAKISEDISDAANVSKFYNIRELKTVSNLWDDLDWLTFINRVFGSADVSVKASEPVYVVTPSYFSNLSSVFSNTSNQTLENYAKWQTIRPYFSYLSESLLLSDKSWNLLSPKGEESAMATERYKVCVQFVQSILPMALGRMFAEHILPDTTKGNVSMMIDFIKKSFKERLDNNTWIDNTTRSLCKEKVDAVSTFISYPDQLFNNTYLNGLYEQYNISSTDYFGNFRWSTSFQFLDSLRDLHKSVSKEKVMWANPPTQLNAFYNPPVNSLIIMEGISRPPWFNPQWPDYFKFGALGAVAGHELTHGFDNKGRNYDKDGIYRQWWTKKSIAKFENLTQCFVTQYSKYELYGHKVHGENSLPDNIADNGGMKVSYQAYKDFAKKHPKAKSLPALTKYTPEQMYFIAWGQLWCAIFTEEGFSKQAKGDHSPGPFRVMGTVVNSPEFADTFKCSNTAKMNPAHKCGLW